MIHQFDHRWSGCTNNGTTPTDSSTKDKVDPRFDPFPRYWVPEGEVNRRLSQKHWQYKWLLGWRGICRATDERTVISTVFPIAGVSNSLPLMIFAGDFPPQKIAALIGNLSSVTLDFAARHKVGGSNLNFFTYQQLPILSPNFFNKRRLSYIIQRVIRLTYTSHTITPFARNLGYKGPPFAWDEDKRAYLRADLDAFYARAYGLNRNELLYILDPTEAKGVHYPSQTFRVLKTKELRKFGEFRTARLVLAAWDRMETNGEFGDIDM